MDEQKENVIYKKINNKGNPNRTFSRQLFDYNYNYLNYYKREELMNLAKENYTIYQRLNAKNSSYTINSHLRDYEKAQYYKKNYCKYPSIDFYRTSKSSSFCPIFNYCTFNNYNNINIEFENEYIKKNNFKTFHKNKSFSQINNINRGRQRNLNDMVRNHYQLKNYYGYGINKKDDDNNKNEIIISKDKKEEKQDTKYNSNSGDNIENNNNKEDKNEYIKDKKNEEDKYNNNIIEKNNKKEKDDKDLELLVDKLKYGKNDEPRSNINNEYKPIKEDKDKKLESKDIEMGNETNKSKKNSKNKNENIEEDNNKQNNNKNEEKNLKNKSKSNSEDDIVSDNYEDMEI